MRDFNTEFQDIVSNQLPTMAERTKQALNDSQVQAAFDVIKQEDDLSYLYFLNLLAQKYGLDMDMGEEVYRRLAYRRQLASG